MSSSPLSACSSGPIAMNEDAGGLCHTSNENGSGDDDDMLIGGSKDDMPNTKPRPFSLLKSFIGECICEVMPSTDGKGLSATSQFVELHGLQYISLGAVTDELTPKQRIKDTLEHLGTQVERLVSIGYLVDDDDDTSASGTAGGGRAKKRAESIPLEVWSRAYPNDRNMSKSVLRKVEKLKAKQFGSVLNDFRKDLEAQQSRPLRDSNFFRIGISAHNVGVVAMLAQRDELVVPFFQDAVRFKKEAYGADHPEVAISLDELGIQLFAREKFEQALAHFTDARTIRLSAFGQFHPKVVMSLNNIGCCNYQMGNREAAVMSLQEANDAVQTNLDSSGGAAKASIELLHKAILLNNLGYLKLSLKQYEGARTLFDEALLIQQSVLGDAHTHRAIRDTRSNLEFTNAFHS